MICLSRAQLEEVSGYRQKSRIAQWLRQNGFNFRVGADGWPRVDKDHYHGVMGTRTPKSLTNSKPNVGALMEMQRHGKKTDNQTRSS